MDRRTLEMRLQDVEGFEHPDAELEQYRTPPGVASVLLWQAYMSGDIENRRVIDLGCGTGVLSIGAGILGAREVIGVENDADALETARMNSEKLGVDIDFRMEDVKDLEIKGDTVVQNPPFGSQEKGNDRPFISKALETAPVVYSLHMAETEEFIRKFVDGLGAKVSLAQELRFPIERSMPWHSEEVKTVDVMLYKFERI